MMINKKLFNICSVISVIFLSSLMCFAADEASVREFFDSYVKDANAYRKNIPDYYADNAKIIRVVIKPDGTKESVSFSSGDYMRQLKKKSKFARLVRYKNRYENVNVEELDGGKYRVSALRYPMRDKKGLNFHFIIQETDRGLKIIEESMETTVQDFLKYAKD